MTQQKHENIKEWGLAILLALLFTLLFKQFVYQSYIVNTDKMMGALKPGSRVLVNKFSYGSRLPITFISLPFFDHIYSSSIVFQPVRIPALASVKRNDIVAYNQPYNFKLPIDKRKVDFSRCIALPGDTLYINNKKVFVNNKYQKFPDQTLLSYRIITEKQVVDSSWFQKYGVLGGAMVSEIGIYDLPLSLLQVARMDKDPLIKFMRELREFYNVKQVGGFPESESISWNKDFFGSVVIPYKGQVIELTPKNLILFADVIKEELNDIRFDGNQVFVNEKALNYYTIKQDYYFLMDDNRDYAFDSRNWGFLPKSHLVGRVDLIWLTGLSNRLWTNEIRLFQVPK